MNSRSPTAPLSISVPTHWSPQQALAALECLHAMREAIWLVYGNQAQQARRDQLVPDRGPMPHLDTELPF